MSTDFTFFGTVIPKEKLLEAVKKLNFVVAREEDGKMCIANGDSHLWFYGDDDGFYSAIRHGNNYDAEEDVLAPLAEALEFGYASEHDEEYDEYFNELNEEE